MSFTGRLEGNVPKGLKSRWSVTGGSIADGQGTLNLKVTGEWTQGASVTATLEVIGLPVSCPSVVSEFGGFVVDPGPILINEFGWLSNTDILRKMNPLFVDLDKNLNSQGYIILYGSEREMSTRERMITSRINFRRFDRSRITIVRAGRHDSGKVYTKLYRVPPGAGNPVP